MELRDYQVNIIEKVKNAWKENYKYPCIVAPCGAGKTVILAEMAKRATLNKKHVMFIVHRKELCEQTEKTFLNYGVDMNYCHIHMIQTVSRHLESIQAPDLILVDENHHCKANSYRKVFDKFADSYRIGVTATPIRLDGSGFQDVNDVLIEEVSTKWLIANNYLSPSKLYSAPLIDTKKITISKGEFDSSECELILDNAAIYGDVLKTWKEKSDNKQTIVYCVSVKHSKNTAEMFSNNNITAAHIDGSTKKTDREEIIQKFRNGEIKILCNCDIVSEGFDVPDCECVILLRPTQSLTLYIQQSMRCMRYKPDKQAIVLDHVGNVFRFGLPEKDREWTLQGKKRNKRTKQKDDNTFWVCEVCYHTWSKEDGRVCPECNTPIPLTEREIKLQETIELIEITENMFKRSRKEHREELKQIQQERGYKKGWIWYQMRNFDDKFRKKIDKLKKGANTHVENYT
jgi:superfamily II DNA or RNA helicase